MNENPESLYANDYFEYLHNRGRIRKLVRKIYLEDIRKYCQGKTIDFGCGVGELLSILAQGSIGFEVNPVAVTFCKSKGLNVEMYEPENDHYQFNMIPEGKFTSFTMNHVLEHIENSNEVINTIFDSCARLGIKRIVFTVPGYKGFLSDNTHQTFIDRKYFMENGFLDHRHYKFLLSKYFPVNAEFFGHYFTHNELRLVFDARIV